MSLNLSYLSSETKTPSGNHPGKFRHYDNSISPVKQSLNESALSPSVSPSAGMRTAEGKPGLRSPTALMNSDISTWASLSSKKRRSLLDRHILMPDYVHSLASPSHKERFLRHRGNRDPNHNSEDNAHEKNHVPKIPSVNLNQINTPQRMKNLPSKSEGNVLQTPASLRFMSRDTGHTFSSFKSSVNAHLEYGNRKLFSSDSRGSPNLNFSTTSIDESSSIEEDEEDDEIFASIEENTLRRKGSLKSAHDTEREIECSKGEQTDKESPPSEPSEEQTKERDETALASKIEPRDNDSDNACVVPENFQKLLLEQECLMDEIAQVRMKENVLLKKLQENHQKVKKLFSLDFTH